MHNRITRDKKLTLLAVGMASAMVFSVLCTVGVYFETNDDRYIAEILAGVIAPGPDAHAVYINYLLALPLSLAYRITAAVPWYGGCLILFQLLTYFCMLDSACSCCGSWKQAAAVVAGGGAFFLSNLYMLGQIQFTSTAALMAGAGYVCLLLHRRSGRGIVYFALLELAALLLRGQSMLMIQPVGAAVLAGWVLSAEGGGLKEKCSKLLRPAMVLLAVIIAGGAAGAAAYHSREWKEYEAFNRARTEMFDYYGVPAYEDVKEVLDKYGITRTQYQAFQGYDLLGREIGADCAQELAAYASDHARPDDSLSETAKAAVDSLLHGEFWGINSFMACSWILLAAVCIMKRKWRLILPGAGAAAAAALVWGYLSWKGRMPLRVTLPLFACVTALVTALVLKAVCEDRQSGGKKQIVKNVVFVGIFAVFLVMGIASGKSQYRYVRQINEVSEIYIDGMRQLQDYCRQHPDKRFVIEAGALSYYRGSALETAIYQPRNSIVSGCWYSDSPVMGKKTEEYLSQSRDGIYLILYEDGNSVNHDIIKYMTEKTGLEPVKEDEFTVSNGTGYTVYYAAGQE